ncbi:MAG TPA: glutamate--tRNA ligase, partial [Marmoricola sp.]|nr:glutamate--tRNA ligase [Marmoricola sp.]
TPYLQGEGILANPVTPEQQELLTRAMPLVNERMNKLTEAGSMLGFLFSPEIEYDPAAVSANLNAEGLAVVAAAASALTDLAEWTTESIDAALRAKLIEEMGLKPRHAFGPVRVALTGRKVSPPLFESLELLGRDESLRRLAAAATAGGAGE